MTTNIRAIFILLLFFGINTSTRAIAQNTAGGFDLATTLQFRTYSPGLSIGSTAGYGIKVWGENSSPNDASGAPRFLYGFMRPYATAVISPSLMEGLVGFEVFPISILGLDVKRSFSRRFSETKGQNCSQVECLGELNSTDVSVQSFLGFRDFFLSLRGTKTFYDSMATSSGATTKPIYDLGTAVLLTSTGDTGRFLTVAAGRKIDDAFSLGLLWQQAEIEKSEQTQSAQYAFIQTDLENIGFEKGMVTLGLGRFQSSLSIAEFSAIVVVTSTHTPAIGFGR